MTRCFTSIRYPFYQNLGIESGIMIYSTYQSIRKQKIMIVPNMKRSAGLNT